ncbi:MAG: HAD family hydrolase [Thermodesulfobacteriota bacterium]|nr:HAD family hydrolase [Thermodesulfobacteriota bacterium]
MRYKAVVFDLDGTLLDTLDDIGDSANRVLAQRGFPIHSMDDYSQFVGDGARELVIRSLPENKRDRETVNACFEEFRMVYRENWQVKTRLYDGIREMLDALQKRGIKMAVLSNKPHEFAVQCVEAFLSDWRFEVVFGERASVPRKPDPAGALEIIDHLKCPAASFVYLGDTGVDMETAARAGMFPVGVLWGFRKKEELLDHGAKRLIDRPVDLLECWK